MSVIEFKPFQNNKYLLKPIPAIQYLPEWYKSSSTFYGTEKNNFTFYGPFQSNHTYKKCVPYLDALSMGYYIFLQEDVIVNQIKQDFHISWKNANNVIISEHNPEQINGIKFFNKNDFSTCVYKWMNSFFIKTKPGYSCLFTHPMNRFDLPFTTISGVVDTDKHGLDINFPFFLRSDFNGIINRGTPIAQIIPFKRENWKSKQGKFYNELEDKRTELNMFLYNAYRKLSWTRKSYK